MAHYSTVSAVKTRTGVTHDDLGLADNEALEAFITELLTEVSDLMQRRMRRDWLAELAAATISEIPAGLAGLAADLAGDSIREMIATRQTPVVRIDDFAVRTVSTRLFSADVEKRLRLYARSGLATIDVTADVAGRSNLISAADLATMDQDL